MFERKNQPLVPTHKFYGRLIRSVGAGAVLIAFSLSIGMIGYHGWGQLAWIDAFLDASMILSGMGPLSTLHTTAGKLFAGCYAIYCGIALIATTAIILAPVIHRAVHWFHLKDDSRN